MQTKICVAYFFKNYFYNALKYTLNCKYKIYVNEGRLNLAYQYLNKHVIFD